MIYFLEFVYLLKVLFFFFVEDIFGFFKLVVVIYGIRYIYFLIILKLECSNFVRNLVILFIMMIYYLLSINLIFFIIEKEIVFLF